MVDGEEKYEISKCNEIVVPLVRQLRLYNIGIRYVTDNLYT